MKLLKILTLSSLLLAGITSVAQAATVSGVEGRVVVERAGKQSLVQTGTVLQEGDRLITTAAGRVKVQFDQCASRNFPDNSRIYGNNEMFKFSVANQCGNAQKVRVRTETVRDGTGFNNRPVNLSNAVSNAVPRAAGLGGMSAGSIAAIGAGVIAGGALINEITKDDDKCTSGC
ncbi:hypothetical protein [Thiofilum flexile]|uniref:hypothetical protein n=1 Tax=Thiofilum flexile TaxID=125627 RepID=UPI00035DB0E0|nr:hypothetical protein [Thiofilum flexile]